MIPAIVLRPSPGGERTVAAARAAGLDAHGFALSAISPRAWDPPTSGGIDALLLGSANALRHAGRALDAYRGKLAYVVGEQTARASRDAGLAIAAIGGGGLQQVLDDMRPGDEQSDLRLLRLAGATRIPLAPPPGVSIVERVVYASEPVAMPVVLAALLARPAVVLLHSAAAAAHFARECDRLQVDRSRIALAALGPRIARAAGEGWRACVAANRPDDAALLALARAMCKKGH